MHRVDGESRFIQFRRSLVETVYQQLTVFAKEADIATSTGHRTQREGDAPPRWDRATPP